MDIELEIEAVEHWVGAFKADILARAVDETDHRVIIENQFGRTNHGHLGQILTCLAGIEGAKTVVWIAESIQADHRAAIDWLNNNTTEQFSFFAIEIELWRIGNSPPAPRFNVIASPNDWTKAVKVSDLGERESHPVRLAYWASFADYLKEKGSTFAKAIGAPPSPAAIRASPGAKVLRPERLSRPLDDGSGNRRDLDGVPADRVLDKNSGVRRGAHQDGEGLRLLMPRVFHDPVIVTGQGAAEHR